MSRSRLPRIRRDQHHRATASVALDFQYSLRLKRFQSPVGGFSVFDPSIFQKSRGDFEFLGAVHIGIRQ